jgi:Zn2+/Cd2+-exporting ATPase
MNKTTFELTGITCANCAQKIEDTIGNVKGVQDAKLNFATQRLDIVFGQDMSAQALENEVRKAVAGIESGAEVLSKASSLETGSSLKPSVLNRKLKKNIAALITGVLLFTAGLLTKENFSLSFILFLLAWLSAGGSVLYRAAKNILKGRIFDENLLMTIATVGAIATAQYPEAAAVMLFYKVGMLLEDMAVGSSRRSIAALMDLKPEYASLKTEAGTVRVAPETVKAGDIIVVKPGERIPLDCCVMEGESFIDTSSLTGESLPVKASPGDQLLGGCINKTGLLALQAVNTLEQSAITRILALVQDAASKKAPMESFINRFAAYYTPVVTAAAFLTAVLPPIVTGSMDFKTWLYRAMIFLVISCPCALVVSIPLTFFAGIGKASSLGILVKGGNYLEALNKVDTVVFDKTGTLTEGVFSVSEILPEGCSEAELLEYAAYAEANSLHPIAQSIVREFGKSIDEATIESCEEAAGKGVTATIRGHLTAAGNLDYIKGFCITPDAKHDSTAGTLVYVAVDGEYKGLIRVSDTLRKDALKAVDGLRKHGVQRIIMLTGDSQKPAEAVGKALGLDEIHYGLLPDQKVKIFEQVKKSSKGSVIFVGDGINDAPVLAMADIGVSMGGLGSDAAIEASDIVLMTDEPSKLIEAVKTASITRKIALQNIVFAISIKVLVLLLGVTGLATMWEAVFADVGVTLLAVLNTLRIGVKIKDSNLS